MLFKKDEYTKIYAGKIIELRKASLYVHENISKYKYMVTISKQHTILKC
jgi:hypothetical protein